jgi:hypothetical protein
VGGLDKAGVIQRYVRHGRSFQLMKTIESPVPEANGFFGGWLVGHSAERVLTFSGSQPWRSWLIARDGSVVEGPDFPTTLGALRISGRLDVAIGIRPNEHSGLLELEVWR